MKSFILSVFFFSFLANVALSEKLPSIFKACHQKDPKLNECILKNARDGIKEFSKGIPEKGVPASDPILLKKITPVSGGTLNLFVTDCNVYKTSDLKFKKLSVDLEKQRVDGMMVGDLEFIGKYEMDGRLLILPITGKGDITALAKNGDIKFSFEYKLVPKNGKEYVKLTKTSLASTRVENVHFKLTNLFGGDKLLGENTNKVLNENWQVVYDELSPSVFLEGSKAIHKVLQKLFDGIPFDEIVLPN